MCKYCDSIPTMIANAPYYNITMDVNDNGKIVLRSCGSDAECEINFCPFCGRELKEN